MNFLHIDRHNDPWSALPLEKRVEIAEARFTFYDKYLKTGKCKEAYGLGDMKGVVSIWDFASDEEMVRIALEYPGRPFIDTEIIPLVGWQATTKVLKEAKEAIEAARKAAKK